MQQELLENKNLTAFTQHGFSPVTTSGDEHVVGNCIFCSGDKFHINVNTKMWDCKHCGKSGGYKTFINELWKWSLENCTIKELSTLANRRHLRIKTLKGDVGYNPLTGNYLIPCYDIDNKEILNITSFGWHANKKFRGITAGGVQWLINSHVLKERIDELFIVEGEWDYFALTEIFSSLKIQSKIIGLKGALQFPDEIISYLKDKIVHVILHNDDERIVKGKKVQGAGNQGMIKIFNKIAPITRSVDFIHWKEGLKDGYDINDLYIDNKNNAEKTFKYIKENLNPLPPKFDGDIRVKNESDRKRYKGAGVTCEEVYKVFNKHLELETNDMIDATFGCILGNRLPADSIWLYLLGPSGSAKSVMCQAINCHYDIEAIDTFTANTLCSGMNTKSGHDPSLIPKLDGRIAVTKDMTTLLEKPPNVYREIAAQLRSAFDGEYAGRFGGPVGARHFKSKFGYIAGVTYKIENFTEEMTSLGERWIRFVIPSGDIRRIMEKMNSNLVSDTWSVSMEEMRAISREVIDFDYNLKEIAVSKESVDKVMDLAIIIEMLRGTVESDRFSKEITRSPQCAEPTRSFMQLRKELSGICAFKGHRTPDDDDIRLIADIAKGTIPKARHEFLQAVVHNEFNGEIDLGYLSKTLNLPMITCQRTAEKLKALNVIQFGTSKVKQIYRLTDKFKEIMERSGIYE